MSSTNDKKRKKTYYKKCAFQGKRQKHEHVLKPGIKGFLLTCDTPPKRVKVAIAEAYSLFEEYAEKLYGPDISDATSQSSDENSDIEEQIKEELKQESDTKKELRKFQAADTGMKNCIFMQTMLESPRELVTSIFQDLQRTKTPKSRHLMRCLPIDVTCHASVEDITNSVQEFVSDLVSKSQDEVTLMVDVRICNNDSLKNLKPAVVDSLKEIYPNKLALTVTKPDIVLSVYIVKKVCCLSWLKDYLLFKKYNLQEIVTVTAEKLTTSVDTSSSKTESAQVIDAVASNAVCCDAVKEENMAPSEASS